MTVNAVLRNNQEVNKAVEGLSSFGLLPHPYRPKSWDTLKMVEIINHANRDAYILDVGCHSSPILPGLKKIGFKNLYGCDLSLKTKYPTSVMKLYTSVRRREYKPIYEMLDGSNTSYILSEQNLEKTNYEDGMFNYVTSLSVIEHGVNIQNYFREMSRILKTGGLLLTSTDYWPDKIINTRSSDNIFSTEEVTNMIEVADQNGLALIEPIDFTYEDKVVHWYETNLDYTFIFFAMKKVETQ